MKRTILILVLLITAIIAAFPAVVSADAKSSDEGKLVRVGWYESPFNRTDQFGRKSGYAYEYQRKIAAYTGWKYEYVEGSWSELMHKIERGEIDLMSDVSYMENRTKSLLYGSLPMGTETYYIFVASGNTEITAEDYKSLDGKKVGVTKDSVQESLFLDWEKKHGVKADLIETSGPEDDSLSMLDDGTLDAFITLDTYGDPDKTAPVCTIGSSEFYFAVNKKRPDILNELDAAMSRIQEENLHYDHELHEKYLSTLGTILYLDKKEQDWLKEHGPIRVGYQDNYLAFCARDPETGKLTGALKDYLDYASTGMENAELDFEPVCYPTAADAIEALQNDEVDCVFPANLTDSDGEEMGLVMTPPLMTTEMDAVVRASEQKKFIQSDDVTVAVNEGNTNYEMFLVDHFPGWKIAYFPDTPAGLNAIADGKADCVIISNYRFNNIAKQCKELHLTTVYTGVDMDYSLAVSEGDTELYSILCRVTGMVPKSVANAALTYYSTEDAKISFTDLIKENMAVIMTIVALVLLVILILLLRSIRLEKKAREEENLVNNLNRQVFVDPLTSVRNKGAITNYINDIQGRIENGEKIDLAVGMFDCNDLKTVNDTYGHDKGDEYLKAASRLICRVFQHSPVFRIGGDEFAVILQNDDFNNRDELVKKFNESQQEICSSAKNKWNEVDVAMGIAVYDPSVDSTVIDTMRRADKIMYKCKRSEKGEADMEQDSKGGKIG